MQREHVVDHPREIDLFGSERHQRTRVREQLVEDALHAIDLATQDLHALGGLAGEIAVHERGEALDRRERVLELVRDLGRELGERAGRFRMHLQLDLCLCEALAREIEEGAADRATRDDGGREHGGEERGAQEGPRAFGAGWRVEPEPWRREHFGQPPRVVDPREDPDRGDLHGEHHDRAHATGRDDVHDERVEDERGQGGARHAAELEGEDELREAGGPEGDAHAARRVLAVAVHDREHHRAERDDRERVSPRSRIDHDHHEREHEHRGAHLAAQAAHLMEQAEARELVEVTRG